MPDSNSASRHLKKPRSNQKRGNQELSRVDRPKLPAKAPDTHVQITAWQETCKTIRWGIAGATIVGGIAVVTWGVVAINATDAPWWKILFFTAAPPLSIVGTVILLLKKQVTEKINEWSKRNRELESSVDPNRESSELLNDGTHPDDD